MYEAWRYGNKVSFIVITINPFNISQRLNKITALSCCCSRLLLHVILKDIFTHREEKFIDILSRH